MNCNKTKKKRIKKLKERQHYLLTDLDRTMVFSKRFYKEGEDLLPTEFQNGEVISYMTKEALRIVEEESSFIIPTTTRTLDEFKRVEPFQKCEWAIVGNGSIVLHKGSILEEWSEHIEKVTNPLSEEYDFFVNWMNSTFQDVLECKAEIVEKFVFAKIKEGEQEAVKKKMAELNYSNWQFAIQRRKVYLMPKEVSKESAAKYVIQQIGEDNHFYFAGDGILDVKLLNLSVKHLNGCAFSPFGSEAQQLASDKNLKIVSPFVEGAEQILRNVFIRDDSLSKTLFRLAREGKINRNCPGAVLGHIVPNEKEVPEKFVLCKYSIYKEMSWENFIKFLKEGGLEYFTKNVKRFGKKSKEDLERLVLEK